MGTRVLILGAGFGGLELGHDPLRGARRRGRRDPDRQGRRLRLRLLEARRALRPRRPPTRSASPTPTFAKPGVRLLRETVLEIDPGRAPRDRPTPASHEADFLVVALGADYDIDATPGPGRGRQRVLLGRRRRAAAPSCSPAFARGPRDRRRLRRALQVPAGAERVRAAAARPPDASAASATRCEITFVIPLADARCRPRRRPRRRSLAAFAERDIALRARASGSPRSTRRAASPCSTTAASCPSTSSSACPSTARPTSCSRAGMTEDGYVPVDSRTLRDALPGRLRGRRRRDRRRARRPASSPRARRASSPQR